MIMKFDTLTAADYAGQKLDSLLERAARDSAEVMSENDIPKAVTYFAELQETVKSLGAKLSELNKHIENLSYEVLPTMFQNQDVKTVKIDGVGRVTVNVRWNATMIDKQTGLGWLKQTGNAGLIQETVNAQTLGAFAKEEVIAGRPLPDDIFKVSSKPFISISEKPKAEMVGK